MRKQRTSQQNNKEIWKSIPGYNGRYEISNFGRVKSLSRTKRGFHNGNEYFYMSNDKILKATNLPIGYSQVTLFNGKEYKKHSVHRIVAIVFIPNPKKLPFINHKDGDKANQKAENLEWCTAKENMQHAYKILKIKPSQLGRFGGNHNKSRPIIQMDMNKNIIKKWESAMDAVRNGFESSCICRCCQGQQKIHKGYMWKYG